MKTINRIVAAGNAIMDACAVALDYLVAAAVWLTITLYRLHAVMEDGQWGWHCRIPERRRGFYFVCPWCGGSTQEDETFSLTCCQLACQQWHEDNPDGLAVNR